MADYADVHEIDEIDKIFADHPSIEEIVNMCISLGIQRDHSRWGYDNEEAWAYYHELKAMIDQQQRKTA